MTFIGAGHIGMLKRKINMLEQQNEELGAGHIGMLKRKINMLEQQNEELKELEQQIKELKDVIEHHSLHITDENGNKWRVLELSDVEQALSE